MTTEKKSMADQAYEILCEKILCFELAPGLIVSDHSLSQIIGMSRTPIREALIRLQQDGLVENAGPKKNMISKESIQDIEEMFDARMAIECKAVDIIARNGGMPKDLLERLQTFHRELIDSVKVNDVRSNYAADDAFHQTIVEASGNKRLLDFSQRLRKQIMRARFLTVMTPDWFANTIREHKAIITGLKKNDSDMAKAAITTHLEHTIDNYRRILGNTVALTVLTGSMRPD